MTSLAVLLLTAAVTAAAAGGSRPVAGDVAPAVALQAPNGEALPASSVVGAVTVVDFFATWCAPCHRGLQDLAAIRDALGPGIHILLIDVGEDPATVRRFMATFPLPVGAQVALDRTGAGANRWGQDRFPTTFLVDQAGIVRHINRGWGPGYRDRLTRWLRAMLLDEPGVPAPSARP